MSASQRSLRNKINKDRVMTARVGSTKIISLEQTEELSSDENVERQQYELYMSGQTPGIDQQK